jgi:hypothetical protein
MYVNTQTAFLGGIYFLASVVVALTLLYYFTRPRPKNLVVKNMAQPVENITSKSTRPNSSKKRSLFGKKSLFLSRSGVETPIVSAERKTGENNADNKEEPNLKDQQVDKQVDAKEKTGDQKQPAVQANLPPCKSQAQVQPELDKSNAALVSPTLGAEQTTSLPLNQEQMSRPNPPVNPPAEVSTIQPEGSLPLDSAPDKSTNKEDTPILKGDVPNSSTTPDSLILSKTPKSVIGTALNTDQAKAALLETEIKPGGPSIKIVNEKAGVTEMENKPKEVKSSDDFSDLFTEDNDEENEVSRLAKELKDIDSRSILSDSLDLINQFKRK